MSSPAPRHRRSIPRIATAALSVLALLLTVGSWAGWAAVGKVEGNLAVDGSLHALTAPSAASSSDPEPELPVTIPRDSWVTRQGCRADGTTDKTLVTDRVNTAFAVGGRNCVIAAVTYLTGVPVNHFVEVRLLGFKAIVEALGGVTICTTHAISDPVLRHRRAWSGAVSS